MKTIVDHLKATETQKPYIAMLLVQCIYAGMALFSKAAISSGMSSFVFVTYRQAFATVALAPFALFLKSEKAVPLPNKVLLKIFLISFFGLSLSLNMYSIAINYTTATFAAAATNAIPAITFTMAVLLRTEKVSIRKVHGIAKVVGSVLGVSGALVFALVKGPALVNSLESSSSSKNRDDECCSKGDWMKGSLLMILANVLWSLWIIFQGRIVKQYPAKIRLTTLQCAFCCLQSAVAAIVVEKGDASAWKLGWNIHLYSVAYCGLIVTGLTYWLQIWAIQKKGPVFTAMFTPLALIITAIFSASVWHEVLYLGSAGGAVFLVGGLYLVLWGKNKEERQVTKLNNGKISNEGDGEITTKGVHQITIEESSNKDQETSSTKLECITDHDGDDDANHHHHISLSLPLSLIPTPLPPTITSILTA